MSFAQPWMGSVGQMNFTVSLLTYSSWLTSVQRNPCSKLLQHLLLIPCCLD